MTLGVYSSDMMQAVKRAAPKSAQVRALAVQPIAAPRAHTINMQESWQFHARKLNLSCTTDRLCPGHCAAASIPRPSINPTGKRKPHRSTADPAGIQHNPRVLCACSDDRFSVFNVLVLKAARAH